LRFYLNFADFWLKDKAMIIWPLVIISASSDPNLSNKGSLDSSHQDELNGGWIISLGSIDIKMYLKTYFGHFGHYLKIYWCCMHELAIIRRVMTRQIQ
jgi:hypothetical protein